MAGPIQTAIGNMLNTATGALAIGKKLSDDKKKSETKADIERYLKELLKAIKK